MHSVRTLPAGWPAIVVEHIAGREITVTHQETLAALRALAKRGRFVPATTRSLAQLRRVTALWMLVRDGWVICANGAVVMHRGRPDAAWDARIAELVGQSAPTVQVRAAFEREFGTPGRVPWLTSLGDCHGRFLCVVIKRGAVPDGVEATAADLLARYGWHAVLHDRKLYLLPRGLSKGLALTHLRDRLDGPRVMAAGDSVLDLELLAGAEHPVCPSDSELVARGRVPHQARVMRGEHIAGGLAIAREALDWVSDTSAGDRVLRLRT